MKKRFLVYFGLALILAVSAMASRMDHVIRDIKMEGATRLLIIGDFGAGEFTITPDDIESASIVEIKYDKRRIDYDIDYRVKNSKGVLELTSYNRNKNNIDTEDNRWDITLSTRYDTELELEIGACEADLDLGGIPLTELTLEIGAASGEIDFSEPNPKRLRTINIEGGACSLEMYSIGNANFDEFNFSGGVGSFGFDFRGEYKGESEIYIELGLGAAKITLPKNIPVKIEIENANWLSSVDIHGGDLEELDDDLWQSDNFKKAKTRIILNIEVGLGSVDIFFR